MVDAPLPARRRIVAPCCWLLGMLACSLFVDSIAWTQEGGDPAEVAQGNGRQADKPTEEKSSPDADPAPTHPLRSDAWRSQEAIAWELVRQHLPDLTRLLDYLRKQSPEQYQRAIRDLARQASRLESSRERNSLLYAVDLELLKSETQIDLLTAKLQLNNKSDLEQPLRKQLRRHQQLRLKRLAVERSLLKARLTKTESQLEALDRRLEQARKSLDDSVERAFTSILRKANRGGSSASQPPTTRQPKSE